MVSCLLRAQDSGSSGGDGKAEPGSHAPPVWAAHWLSAAFEIPTLRALWALVCEVAFVG